MSLYLHTNSATILPATNILQMQLYELFIFMVLSGITLDKMQLKQSNNADNAYNTTLLKWVIIHRNQWKVSNLGTDGPQTSLDLSKSHITVMYYI